jgi:basic amino acid/polyamine antiporter, APA family
MPSVDAQSADAGLVRAIGTPRLTANIVNTTIGASIFALPAGIAAQLGSAAPLAFVICAAVMTLLVTCIALAGSRVSLTGGMYAYAEVAFGRYVGFIAGLLYYMCAILAIAAVVNVFVDNFVAVVPFLGGRAGRIALAFTIFAGLAITNIRGVRAGANAVALITIAKLIPLLVFVAVGLFFIQPATLAWPGMPTGKALGDAVLLLMFAFVGVETALMPSGEVVNPARTVPRAIYTALAITTLLYMFIQAVAQGTLGAALAGATGAPLADAAATFLGNTGRLLLLGGAALSSFGFIASDILSSPRILFALGRDGILPETFARVHPRYRTPHIAIAAYAIVGFLFSLTSGFEALAVMSNVALLLLYLICIAAAWELMRRDVRAEGEPFTFPGERIVIALALVVVVWVLAHATAREFMVTAAVCLAGSVLYLVRKPALRRRPRAE